jgi:hypothetical protein
MCSERVVGSSTSRIPCNPSGPGASGDRVHGEAGLDRGLLQASKRVGVGGKTEKRVRERAREGWREGRSAFACVCARVGVGGGGVRISAPSHSMC